MSGPPQSTGPRRVTRDEAFVLPPLSSQSGGGLAVKLPDGSVELMADADYRRRFLAQHGATVPGPPRRRLWPRPGFTRGLLTGTLIVLPFWALAAYLLRSVLR